MDVKMQIQSTPNPNALKFVLNTPVKAEGKVSYKNIEDTNDNPLAKELFSIEHAVEVYFFDNYITVTQDGQGDWDTIEEKVQDIILAKIKDHDPNFKSPETTEQTIEAADPNDPEIKRINEILDETVRPALQMDGGDITLMGLDGNVLRVNYQGACGSCPSAAMGTLKAIENILRDGYDPQIVVEIA